MKREVKSVSKCYPVSPFHRPLSWWKSGHDVTPNSRWGWFQESPAKEAALSVPFLGSLSSLPASIRKSNCFCLELKLFILLQTWALASQWESCAFSLVFFSNSSAGHNHTNTVTFPIFKCDETLLHSQILYFASLASVLLFQCHSVSRWEDEKPKGATVPSQGTCCWAGTPT